MSLIDLLEKGVSFEREKTEAKKSSFEKIDTKSSFEREKIDGH